ncbi:MAG TPA: hypothetical protein VFR51_10365 [Pyrinomonadaceae bacterium]|nr:hypothetical protein [Pyrinomonadaceae bacterium]
MKRCPKCYQVYGNIETFCEVDGQRLLPDPGLNVETTELVPDGPPSKNLSLLGTGLVGIVMGVALCGSAYLAYSFFTSASEKPEERPPMAVEVREQPQTRPAPVRVPEAEASPTESPTEEEQAEASPQPSQQTPAEPVSARLNQGPVSTGNQTSPSADGAKVKTIIEMQDGSSVEVDAAWKDNQGVWYRQGSLVSFVEGARVKAITARAEPKNSPSGNQ